MFYKKNSEGDIEVYFGRIILAVVLFFVSIILFFGTFSSVGAGNVGVVTRLGAVNRVVNPGLVVKIPLIEGLIEMETRTQIDQVDASSASKDLQEVRATVALNFHLRGKNAVDVYQNIGVDYRNRIVAPAIQEAFKAVSAQFTASELISKREAVKQLSYVELKKRLEKYNIVVDDFNIVNFKFSSEFDQAIEQKTVAQQNKEKATIEAQTALVQAEGQVNAQQALREGGSLTPEYLNFLAVQKWNGILPNATNGVPFIQIPTR